MKNVINNLYKLFPSELYTIDNGFRFFVKDYEYLFLLYNGEVSNLNILADVSNRLYYKKVYVDTFVPTVLGNLFAEVDGENYVLLRINSSLRDYYNLSDVSKFNYSLSSYSYNLNIKPWYLAWSDKVDLLENTISDLNKEYPLLQEVFPYYVGMAENAISYCKDVFLKEDKLLITINHNRVGVDNTFLYLYNPLTFTFDYDVRDIAEYIKNKFIFHSLDFNEVEELLNNYKFSRSSLMLFFARLMYPSYFFDLCKLILEEEKDESVLNKVVLKAEEYEDFLNDVYFLIKKYHDVPKIDWLIRKFS